MKKVIAAAASATLLALPAVASAGDGNAYGKVVQVATNGCTYGQLVVLAGGPQSHPIAGIGAKRLVEAVVAGAHPAPDCGATG
jgi:hypothetical protein